LEHIELLEDVDDRSSYRLFVAAQGSSPRRNLEAAFSLFYMFTRWR
jgi:hypothetical protein